MPGCSSPVLGVSTAEIPQRWWIMPPPAEPWPRPDYGRMIPRIWSPLAHRAISGKAGGGIFSMRKGADTPMLCPLSPRAEKTPEPDRMTKNGRRPV